MFSVESFSGSTLTMITGILSFSGISDKDFFMLWVIIGQTSVHAVNIKVNTATFDLVLITLFEWSTRENLWLSWLSSNVPEYSGTEFMLQDTCTSNKSTSIN